mgnify:CR=1 FL=1
MKLSKKSILWIIWCVCIVGSGIMLLRNASHSDSIVYRINLFAYALFVVCFPLSEYLKKMKISKLKKELNISGDLTLDQLESFRIERDYKEKYVKRWKQKPSTK